MHVVTRICRFKKNLTHKKSLARKVAKILETVLYTLAVRKSNSTNNHCRAKNITQRQNIR